MRETIQMSKNKPYNKKTPLLCPQMALNTIFISDLEVVVERRACICTKIEILLKSRRLHASTGTSKCSTGTKSVLVFHSLGVPVPIYWVMVPPPHCMWVPVPVSVVPVQLPLQPATFHCSTTWGFSIAAFVNNDDLHLFSGNKTLQKLCMGLEKPAHA